MRNMDVKSNVAENKIRECMLHGPKGRIFVRHWAREPGLANPKTPIVLLHESLGCTAHWRDFPALLCRETDREVIAYDRLGFGQSDPFPGTLPHSFVQDEVNESFAVVRESLKIDRFIAFGHSVGGTMAVAIAAALPGACRGIVTMAALSMIEPLTIDGVSRAKAFFSQPEQLNRLRQYHGDKAEWVLGAWVDTWLSERFRGWNLDECLAQVSSPALIMHGEQDEYASTRHAERIMGNLRHRSSMMVIPNAGHFPHRTHANEVMTSIKTFLSGDHLDQ